MAILNKETLKAFFKKGTRPTEGNFSDLIDSMYNKLDDMISSSTSTDTPAQPGQSNNALLFTKIDNDAEQGLSFTEAVKGDLIMKLSAANSAGINKVAPLYKLLVNGAIAAPARVGTYTGEKNTVLANGQWQPILTGLDGLNIFEIVASANGPAKSGNYALLHATALSTFGNSKSSIVQHSARYKGFCKNIKLRWTGDIHKYNLEIRTTRNFGDGIVIKYNVTQLICE